MYKLILNEIIVSNILQSILSIEVEKKAYMNYVEEQVIKDGSLWDNMSKVKLLT